MIASMPVHIFEQNEVVESYLKDLFDNIEFTPTFHDNISNYTPKFPVDLPFITMIGNSSDNSFIYELISDTRRLKTFTDVIVYSSKPALDFVVDVIKFGAFYFLEIPTDKERLVESLIRASDYNLIHQEILSKESAMLSRLTRLTIRESMILKKIIEGTRNKIIAYELNISQRTVENHRASIMMKLEAKSITHLINMINNIEKKND